MKHKNIYFTASIIGLLAFIFAYDSANLAGSIKYLSAYFDIPKTQVGILVVVTLVGNLFGSVFSGYFADKIGRKKTLIYSISIGICGLFLTFLSTHIAMFSIGRILYGLYAGSVMVAGATYVTEVSPATKRGRTGTLRQLFTAFGLIMGYGVTFFFNSNFALDWNIKIGWRFLILLEISFAIITFFFLLTLVESPRWLMLKGRTDEAKESLACFTSSQEEIETSYNEMLKNNVEKDDKKKIKIKGGLGYALAIAIVLPIFRQLSGTSAIGYYAQEIFKTIADDSSNMAYFQSIFIGVSELLGALFIVVFVNKFGRKFFFILGAVGMFTAEAVITYFLYKNKIYFDLSYFVYVYNFFFIISLGSLMTVYITEALPTTIRSVGTSISGVINWIIASTVVYSYPLLNANIYLTERFHQSFPFLIFSLSMIAFLIVIKFLPETKGKTLENITDFWKTKGNWEDS